MRGARVVLCADREGARVQTSCHHRAQVVPYESMDLTTIVNTAFVVLVPSRDLPELRNAPPLPPPLLPPPLLAPPGVVVPRREGGAMIYHMAPPRPYIGPGLPHMYRAPGAMGFVCETCLFAPSGVCDACNLSRRL